MMKENHILMHTDVLDAVLADYSGRFVSRRDYNDGKTYGYVTNLKNQNIAIEYTHYKNKNQLGERHALSDNERFDFDNQMIKKYIPQIAERVEEIEREEGSALRLPISVPVSIYFDRSRRGMDENGRPSEFLIIIEEKGKGRKHIWKADGREAVVAYLDEYAKNVLPRLDRYEKRRPDATGRPGDVAEATSDTANIIPLPPKKVNGGTK